MKFRNLLVAAAALAGSQAWGQVFLNQSPVDIASASAVYTPSLPALSFAYGSTSLTVFNTGSPDTEATVRGVVPSGAASLTVGGSSYNLLQFHFHTGSEHEINGVATPMEIHLVHRDLAGNLLVVGRQIIEGAENALLAPIFSSLPAVGSNGSLLNSFDLAGLIPSTLTSFRYSGSLTTAPYTEGVSWVVLSDPLAVSHDQITAFQALFPDGDSREVQTLHGRVIQTDVVGFAAVPEPSEYGVMAGVTLSAFVWARRRARKASAARN